MAKKAGTVTDDTYVNYSCPEQPTRLFETQDVLYLLKRLNFTIRRLEGMREVDKRNHLHFNESTELNDAKLTRKIVEEWLNTKKKKCQPSFS